MSEGYPCLGSFRFPLLETMTLTKHHAQICNNNSGPKKVILGLHFALCALRLFFFFFL